jgi:hypothetical protein
MEIGVILLLFGLRDSKIWLISRRLKMEFGGWRLEIFLKNSHSFNIAYLQAMNDKFTYCKDEKII